MARGINKGIIIGNLGQDPEVRYTPNGDAVANFSVATSEAWKDKETGEKVEKTEWHRIVLFRRDADNAGEYLRKGSKVYIEGSLRTRKWQGEDGTDRYSTEIIGRQVQFLDPAPSGGAQGRSGSRDQGRGATTGRGSPTGGSQSRSGGDSGSGSQRGGSSGSAPPATEPDFDDDIPF